jgi:hypothetical protein
MDRITLALRLQAFNDWDQLSVEPRRVANEASVTFLSSISIRRSLGVLNELKSDRRINPCHTTCSQNAIFSTGRPRS